MTHKLSLLFPIHMHLRVMFETGDNGLNGILPPELKALSALTEFLVPGNTLRGTLVELPTTVTFLDVESNLLGGAPFASLSKLTELERLRISTNEFTGTIPTELGALENLAELWIANNRFDGATIPTEMGNLRNLGTYFNTNMGASNCADELWHRRSRSILTYGMYISVYALLAETLFVYNSSIGGTIPSELGNLDLTEFLANDNKFVSSIPDQFWNNERLTILRLDSNQLTGSLASRLGNLVGLTDLFLNSNSFEGTIPVTMLRLTSLGMTTLSRWLLLKSLLFPTFSLLSIFSSPHLQVNLLLNDNMLTGTLRDGFESFQNLDFVDFSSNDFSGSVPSTLFNIRDLRFLYLNSNQLRSSIPDNWGNAVLLRDLYLDNNNLSGSVPQISQGAFTRLTELLIHGNEFTGQMPGSICQLRSSGILEDLWADCGGNPPEIQCALPSCCTFCFE